MTTLLKDTKLREQYKKDIQEAVEQWEKMGSHGDLNKYLNENVRVNYMGDKK